MPLDDQFVSRIRADLSRDEGIRLKLYRCTAGKLSIAAGRNLEDRGITLPEALFMLETDIATTEADLDRQFPWWRQLPVPAQIGLFNMCYNLGPTRLSGFKGMLGALKNGDGEAASVHALQSKWAGQVGARAHRIAGLYRQR